jgi:small subunit ribosomal protein S16
MLVIKLAQTGKTNKKMFRLIVSEKGRDPYGDILEILGAYNPHSKELAAKADRVQYWLSKGAQTTATVNNLLVEKKLIEGKKQTASKAGKPSEKRQAQVKAKADKKAARETAAAPVAAAEAPAEAVATETKDETPAA